MYELKVYDFNGILIMTHLFTKGGMGLKCNIPIEHVGEITIFPVKEESDENQ